MTNTVLHKSESRGEANHGWLQAKHSFSFANFYNPEKINFGALRVLNDDIIAAGMGFGMHPHDNMEIITIPLEGALQHKDSMGNTSIIEKGDIQVMSAGTGIRHSEFNPNKDNEVKLLQIWVIPNAQNVEPRYDQITLSKKNNSLQQIISPNKNEDGIWIHQNAWFHIGNFNSGKTIDYHLKMNENGIYVFNISGEISVNGENLYQRDALGIWNTNKIEINTKSDSEFLIIEVPMEW